MSSLPRVTEVEHLRDYQLRLTFSDGLVRELDFDGILEGGVFEDIKDVSYFREVALDTVAGTIYWPNGVDLDPDVLHGDFEPASGRAAKLLREYHVHAAS